MEHVLRNCNHHDRYMREHKHSVNLCKATEILANSVTNGECTEDSDEISDHVESAEETIFADGEQEYAEFYKWENHLLQTLDVNPNVENVSNRQSSLSTYHSQVDHSDQDDFYLKFSIDELKQIQQSIAHVMSFMKKISNYMLMDTGTRKSICSKAWMFAAKWKPVCTLELSSGMKLFWFVGHIFYPNCVTCLIAAFVEMHGGKYLFRHVVFVLPEVPIPFSLFFKFNDHLVSMYVYEREKAVISESMYGTLQSHFMSVLTFGYNSINEMLIMNLTLIGILWSRKRWT